MTDKQYNRLLDIVTESVMRQLREAQDEKLQTNKEKQD